MRLPAFSFSGPQNAGVIDTLKRTNASSPENGLPAMVIPLWLENAFEQGGKQPGK